MQVPGALSGASSAGTAHRWPPCACTSCSGAQECPSSSCSPYTSPGGRAPQSTDTRSGGPGRDKHPHTHTRRTQTEEGLRELISHVNSVIAEICSRVILPVWGNTVGTSNEGGDDPHHDLVEAHLLLAAALLASTEHLQSHDLPVAAYIPEDLPEQSTGLSKHISLDLPGMMTSARVVVLLARNSAISGGSRMVGSRMVGCRTAAGLRIGLTLSLNRGSLSAGHTGLGLLDKEEDH